MGLGNSGIGLTFTQMPLTDIPLFKETLTGKEGSMHVCVADSSACNFIFINIKVVQSVHLIPFLKAVHVTYELQKMRVCTLLSDGNVF